MKPLRSPTAMARCAEIGAALGRRFPDANLVLIGDAVLECRAAAISHAKLLKDESSGAFDGPLAAGEYGRRRRYAARMRDRAGEALAAMGAAQVVRLVYVDDWRGKSSIVIPGATELEPRVTLSLI